MIRRKMGRLLRPSIRNFYNFFLCILFGLLAGMFILPILQFLNSKSHFHDVNPRKLLSSPNLWNVVRINTSSSRHSSEGQFYSQNCNFFKCFNIYRCGRSGHRKISVYVYPMTHFYDENGNELNPPSREFLSLLKAVISSEYYSPNPHEACLFIPPIDTLNESNLKKDQLVAALTYFKYWSGGENHILFNLLPGVAPDFRPSFGLRKGKVIVAGGGFSSLFYRPGFDVSLPVFNPLHQEIHPSHLLVSERSWYIVSSQINIHQDHRDDLDTQSLSYGSEKLLVLSNCLQTNISRRCQGSVVFDYPGVLSQSKFCLVIRGGRLGQTALYDAMRAGCVPIIVADLYVLPFSEVIDWREAAIVLYEQELPDVVSIIDKNVSFLRLKQMQQQVIWLYHKYFASMELIALTTLKILNDRIFPSKALTQREWNTRPIPNAIQTPLFLPYTAPASEGFTAVVLTYDRVASLFQVIENIAKVPSINKIVVVWNNQKMKPPFTSSWPKIEVPLKVFQMSENKLSNRFYPFDEITTECILAIDDDITMMTPDELEFGYQVWREFPDRIVGFPSRNVLWSNTTNTWTYNSEWTNEVSMVLTGVAFYHKYYSYVYSTQLPDDLKQWVDYHLNCEDIAMNFLIANKTGKAPIKVTPRKKFKCTECSNPELSMNELHFVERSQCVRHFVKIFGTMPLKTVEFRADPVLFKEKLPSKVKLFNEVGSL